MEAFVSSEGLWQRSLTVLSNIEVSDESHSRRKSRLIEVPYTNQEFRQRSPGTISAQAFKEDVFFMDLKYIYTRLNVKNFQACKAFYQEVLGLPLKFEDDMDEYAEFDTGATVITLFNRQKLADFVTREDALTYDVHSAQVVISFQVTDLKAAIAHLKSHDIELLNPPTGYPDRGFVSTCFRDPDGNLIELEQTMDIVVA